MNKEGLKFCDNPKLETERLILRKIQEDDAEDVFGYAKNPEVAKYTTWEAHKSLKDTKIYINWVIGRYKNDETGDWVIQLKETGKIIGSLGFAQLDLHNSCGSIGYALGKEYWGRGIATEAVKRLIQFGFEEMELNRIDAVHIPENEASGKVMQKSGMKYEGLIRQKLFAKGIFWDVKQYSITKDEWMGENRVI